MYANCRIQVTIGNKVLETVHSAIIKNDSKEIGSSCRIVVPLMSRISYVGARNTYLTDQVRNLFKSADPVTVVAWYDGYPQLTVFTGFVYNFIEGTPMTIVCMDDIFLLNMTTVDLSYRTVTIRDLCKRLLQGTDITLIEPTIDLTLAKVTFSLMSPASVLEWLKQQIGLNISLNNKKLYVNIASNTVSQVFYDSRVNVIHCGLQKPEAVYLKLKLRAWFILTNGTKKYLEVGDTNGELREVWFYNIPYDEAKYKKLAGEALVKYKMMKFAGTIETLLYPDCGLFWKTQYIDESYPERNGNYTITGIDIMLNEEGFHRKVKMSFLSDIDSSVNALANQNQIISLNE